MLTSAQLATLSQDIANDPALASLPMNSDSSVVIVDAYAQLAVPDFIVWRTDVQAAEIYHLTSTAVPPTTWNWTTFKNQSVAEQTAWEQMFASGSGNFALPNFRSGVAAIFTGSAQANAQRDHCLAIGKRRANRGEKLLTILGSGDGTTLQPATMGFEGRLTTQDVDSARNLP
jgi:hypothetical protein